MKLDDAGTFKEPNQTKLTTWKNEPSVSDLKCDLTGAQSDHSLQVTKINNWLDALFVRNSHAPTKRKNRSSIQPKLIRKQAEWRYASLSEPFLSNDDLFSGEPHTYEDVKAAQQNVLVLNNQFNTKLGKVKFINDYVRTGVDEGTIIVKIGWEYQEEILKKEVPEYDYYLTEDPEHIQQLEMYAQMEQENPIGFKLDLLDHELAVYELSKQNGTPFWYELTGVILQEEEVRVIKNHPTLKICDYNNVIIDPSCLGDTTKAGFIIESFETSKSELQKSGLYTNLDQINVQNASVLSAPDSHNTESTSFNFKDDARKRILAYEYWGYWDINKDGITKPIVATFVGDVMIRLEENPFPSGFLPYEIVQYLPVRRSAYGEPDGVLLEDTQRISGAVMRGMIDIMGRSANGQIGYRKDALDVTNKAKFLAGDDYEYNPNIDPNQAFYLHKFSEVPRSAEYILETMNREAESLTGTKGFSGGISGSALGNTATGVRSALDATAKRDLDILRRLASGLESIGRKIIAMNGLFLSEEETIRITNEEFVKIRRDDLKGHFDIRLTISTAEVDNQKAEELAFMLQTTGNTMDFSVTQMILVDIAKLRKMPALAKKLETYQPQPDPIAEEMRQLELEKLKAEIAKLYADAGKKEAEAGMTPYKAETEIAKQRHLNSVADKTDLDFVEQETGTKQERELQKHRAQAEANMDLKLLDSVINPRNRKQ